MATIQRTTLSEQVAKGIKELIVAGPLAPGARLPSEPALCERFGVSRIVVREALKALGAAGVISVKHGRGAFVEEFSGKGIAERLAFGLADEDCGLEQLIEVRLVVETGGADLAARRGTDEDWSALRAILAQMRREAKSGLSTATSDLAFHRRLLKAAGNAPLCRLGEVIAEFFRQVVPSFPPMSELYTPQEQVCEHEAILNAVATGDTAEAKRLLRETLYRYLTLPPRRGSDRGPIS